MVRPRPSVLDLHLELGVTGAVDPLLEELLEPAPADVFDARASGRGVSTIDRACARQVRATPAPEHVVAERRARSM
mgnify:CR=1 FL=1